jgi:hypothetical protein
MQQLTCPSAPPPAPPAPAGPLAACPGPACAECRLQAASLLDTLAATPSGACLDSPAGASRRELCLDATSQLMQTLDECSNMAATHFAAFSSGAAAGNFSSFCAAAGARAWPAGGVCC